MRLTCALVVLSVAMVSMSPTIEAERAERIQAASEAVEPFRVIGNIYYVGGQYGSYLITTPEGHILHDTGTVDMHELIISNVEKLGFNIQDIRFMISSHAHWDHIEGHAAMKRVTGAQVVALGGDAVALQSGQDNSALGARGWEPVTVDRGATMWMTTVEENGQTFDVAFRGGEIPNDGAPLVDNPRHPTVVEDTQRTLRRLKELSPPDLFLHNHARYTSSELNPDLPVNPNCASCLDAEGWMAMVASAEARFQSMLTER